MDKPGEREQPSARCLGSRRISKASALLAPALLVVVLLLPRLCAQSSNSAPAPKSPVSLADSIRHSQGKEIHIFYIHGIASDGPDDFDSLALRKSICDYLKDCLAPAGNAIGPWDYADQGEYQIEAEPPPLNYLEEPVWKDKEEWRAAAPYVIHFQLARSGGSTIYVDALNWWPLTFALKCRQIVASDAELVAPSKPRIELCSRRQVNPDVPMRFKSYDWLGKDEAEKLLKHPSNGARVNRRLKNGLMDWGFSDAVIALGPVRPYILSALRQLILKSIADSPGSQSSDQMQTRTDREFIIVSHSLGSYLIFSALDAGGADRDSTALQQSNEKFEQILARTPLVYFFANQLRLLELAGLDGDHDKNLSSHLKAWGKVRCEYLKSLPGSGQQCQPPRITSLNDPSDLLTWTVPALPSVDVVNLSVKNAPHWLGLIEDPASAHGRYAHDKKVITEMLKAGEQDEQK